jgi:hypothetical protein
LARNGSREHETALGNRKYRHTFLIDAARGRVILSNADPRAGAVGRRTRVGARRDRDCARIGAEFEVSGFKLVQRALVFEKDDLAIRLAAGLEAQAYLPMVASPEWTPCT